MTSSADPQLDLLGQAELTGGQRSAGASLGLLLDQRAWLTFLSAEWMLPEHGHQIVLGLNRVFRGPIEDGPRVAVWFDPRKLPAVNVLVHVDSGWVTRKLQDVAATAVEAIAWNGPLPLFAVDRFSVGSSNEKSHLLAMAQGFADVELPAMPFEVERIEVAPGPNARPALTGSMHPPVNWNALRGAASMAAWAVPAIDPWLDLLCESLQDSAPNESADKLRSPWWRFALWSCGLAGAGEPLWSAIVGELETVRSLKELRPRVFLDGVCARAEIFGCDPMRLERLRTQTHRLFDDRGTIDSEGVMEDALGLALQLFLLRPGPESFVGWREDWPAMPPGAWWTGAVLVGYVSGFRALPLYFRGTPEARRLLALRTWKLACSGEKHPWDDLLGHRLDWTREMDFILLRSDTSVWAEHKISRRGRWYQLDYSDEVARSNAEALVRESCPELLTRHLVLDDAHLPLWGEGSIHVDTKKKLLVTKGRVEVELRSGAEVTQRFSEAKFRDWLATASISVPLPPPAFAHKEPMRSHAPVVVTPSSYEKKSELKVAQAKATRVAGDKRTGFDLKPPPGLSTLVDFIDEAEEAQLLATIDASAWDTTMARHVQHYGWKYDYKARKVDPRSYLGPLPDWLAKLGHRLLTRGVFGEMPDQVIVNNYVGAQSISKHIDCIPCFRGPIVTISLNESWEMYFHRKAANEAERKYKQLLLRRSAVVIDGEARLLWEHEIPKRLKEGKIPRGRRVSITFRKVDAPDTR